MNTKHHTIHQSIKAFQKNTLSLASVCFGLISFVALVHALKVDSILGFAVGLCFAVFALVFYISYFKDKLNLSAQLFLLFGLLLYDFLFWGQVGTSVMHTQLYLLLLFFALSIKPARVQFVYCGVFILNLILAYCVLQLNLLNPAPASTLPFTSVWTLSLSIFVFTTASFLYKRSHEQKLETLDVAERAVDNSANALINRNEHLIGFANMVSHNLRSPIAGIKMLLSLYDMKEDQKEREDLIEHLKGGATELFNMVEDLSTVMQDYTKLNSEQEPVLLDEVLHETKATLASEIEQSGISIHANFEVLQVQYLKTYLETIFQELIKNAIKYPHPERTPELHIKSYFEGNKLMLSFVDNGLGVDVEKYERQLFKMYKTFHPDTGKDGKGIGLFLSKNKVDMMGGKISIESAPEKGMTLYLELYRV